MFKSLHIDWLEIRKRIGGYDETKKNLYPSIPIRWVNTAMCDLLQALEYHEVEHFRTQRKRLRSMIEEIQRIEQGESEWG